MTIPIRKDLAIIGTAKSAIVLVAVLAIGNIFRNASAESSSYCAIFNASDSSFGSGLILRDMTVIGNSAEEYLSLEKTWNTTGKWRVNLECKLTVCDDAYLDGTCMSNRRNLDGNETSDPGTWLSAMCECKKNCNCNDVHISKFSCARAYASSRGCNVCQSSALYTELKPGSVEKFSDEWNGNVKSILVRPGCTLTVYDEENFEGNSFAFEDSSQLQIMEQNPGSYQCECSSCESLLSNASVDDSKLMNLPLTLDEIVEVKKSSKYHPGLEATIKSIAMDRSSRNAYILVLGSSGSGKSSTINALLGLPNITISGDSESTTSEIIELRIPIPLPELEIRNSQLCIIDTPGLGDTGGVEKDAQFLASLDEYLNNHEELNKRKPNLVLIFHKFNDNRFDGESSKFVQMLKALNNFRERISDDDSNVLFVFSHLCSTSNSDQRNPSDLLRKFRNVIEKYSLFPKPVHMTVVENKGRDNFLPMVMENYLLPNKEYFPRNLIQKLETVTKNLKDKIGNAIIEQAFMSSESRLENLPVEIIKEIMVPTSHPKATIYLKLLNANTFAMNSTEASELIQQAHEKMKPGVSGHLEYLQRYLNLRNIQTRSDVPQTTAATLKLLCGLPADNKYLYILLKEGLGLTAPMFPENVLSGYGYSSMSDSTLVATPFDLDNLELSSSGYLIPNTLICAKFNETITTKGINNITCRDNLKICKQMYSVGLKIFQFKLKPDNITSLAFTSNVGSLSPFDQEDYENVESWKIFFDTYGTHVITSAAVGGKIDIEFTVPKHLTNSIDVEKFKEEVMTFILGYGLAPKPSSNESDLGINHKLVFHGGNPAYQMTDFTKASLEEFGMTMKMWAKSLLFYPVVFRGEIKPITEYFQNTWSTETYMKVNDALSRYLNSTLKYVPPPTTTPDPKVIEELERQRREQEEEIKRVQEEMKKQKEAEEERKRLAELEAIRLQEEAKKLEDERIRLLEEAEKERIRLENERQAEIRRLEEKRRIQREKDEARQAYELCVMQEKAEAEERRLRRIQHRVQGHHFHHNHNGHGHRHWGMHGGNRQGRHGHGNHHGHRHWRRQSRCTPPT